MGETLSTRKDECVFKLFPRLNDAFRAFYWKKLEATNKELARRGYRLVRVTLKERT
jgi:hypothetical protein